MRFCDVTLSYTETSGGIRTYIDQKRRYLLEHTKHEHVLVIPDEEDSLEQEERCTTHRIASPILPGCAPYRIFLRPDKITHALRESRPDCVELGSFFVCPWAVFRYHKECEHQDHACVVAGYFHTDIADAYVGTPLRHALSEAFGGWSSMLEHLSENLGDVAEAGMERYVRSIFERCDLKLAASPGQVRRLEDYGVHGAEVVPLGVDLDTFHPRCRDPVLRARFSADEGSLVLIYAGRLDDEKHVTVLFDAFTRLPEELDARLLILGEGPLREEFEQRAEALKGVHVLPYESDKHRFASLLASADIYVTAGPHETFGLSVVEAQACGLPVVGVAAGALTERVSPELGFLGPVDDPMEFSKNIQRAAQRLPELSVNARAYVEENYSWSDSFRRLFRLYNEAIRRKRPTSDPAEW